MVGGHLGGVLKGDVRSLRSPPKELSPNGKRGELGTTSWADWSEWAPRALRIGELRCADSGHAEMAEREVVSDWILRVRSAESGGHLFGHLPVDRLPGCESEPAADPHQVGVQRHEQR